MDSIFAFYRSFKGESHSEKLTKLLAMQKNRAVLSFLRRHKQLDFYFYNAQFKRTALYLSCFPTIPNEVLISVLNHPAMRTLKTHPNEVVFDCVLHTLKYGSYDKFFYLKQFFTTQFLKPKAPPIHEFFNRNFLFLSPKQRLEKHFSDFPQQELWRLFVDGVLQRTEIGWLDCELREPGFIKGMYAAFDCLQQHIDEPLNIFHLYELHDKCMRGLIKNAGEFRQKQGVAFSLGAYNTSVLGLFELSDANYHMRSFGPRRRPHLDFGLHALKESEKSLRRKVITFIYNYHQALKVCLTLEDRIFAIIDLICALERLHPFNDGNCRTLCIFILNRELIRSGFSPVILDNPNRFDGYCKEELIGEIYWGMKQFKQVKALNTGVLGRDSQDMHDAIIENPRYYPCSAPYYEINFPAKDRCVLETQTTMHSK